MWQVAFVKVITIYFQDLFHIEHIAYVYQQKGEEKKKKKLAQLRNRSYSKDPCNTPISQWCSYYR